MTDEAGSHLTSLRDDGVVVTVIRGRVGASTIALWATDFETIGHAKVWLFDAMRVTGYDPEAVPAVTRLMTRLKARGLEHVVVATRSPMVKVGAMVVKKGLLMAAGIGVHTFGDVSDANAWISANTHTRPV